MRVGNEILLDCNDIMEEYDLVIFKKFEFFMKIDVFSVNVVKYSVKFCIYDGEGILLFERIMKVNGVKINVFLIGGSIKLCVIFVKKEFFVIFYGGVNFDDGMWYFVFVDISIWWVSL